MRSRALSKISKKSSNNPRKWLLMVELLDLSYPILGIRSFHLTIHSSTSISVECSEILLIYIKDYPIFGPIRLFLEWSHYFFKDTSGHWLKSNIIVKVIFSFHAQKIKQFVFGILIMANVLVLMTDIRYVMDPRIHPLNSSYRVLFGLAMWTGIVPVWLPVVPISPSDYGTSKLELKHHWLTIKLDWPQLQNQ